MDLPFPSWLGSCTCCALRATHSLLPLWEHGCTVGIDRDPPVWRSIQDDGWYQSASSLWIVECGVGAVVKWSCGVIGRCGNMSASQQDADLVYPPLRRGSRRVSWSNPEGAEVGQDSEGENGRKIVEVGGRDRVEVLCGKCGNMRNIARGWRLLFEAPMHATLRCGFAPRVFACSRDSNICAGNVRMTCTCTIVLCEWVSAHPVGCREVFLPANRNWS